MISRSLLRLYPAAWRAHYGDGLVALLDELRLSPLALRVGRPRNALAYPNARECGGRVPSEGRSAAL